MTTKTKEDLYREEFEETYEGLFNFKESCSCPWEYKDSDTVQFWAIYLDAREKSETEIEELNKNIQQQKELIEEFVQISEHAIDLGYLGEGSTKGEFQKIIEKAKELLK